MGTPANLVPADIVSRIVSIRGQRVLFDYDLAAVYGVTTKRLNQQVNRDIERFPADFAFYLETQVHVPSRKEARVSHPDVI
jgi:hypothetical protein